jgi:hypothetical protein
MQQRVLCYGIAANAVNLPISLSPNTIFAGAVAFVGVVDSQINMPGTAAQTKIVRMISQTAVIFSTIDQIDFSLGYISFQNGIQRRGGIKQILLLLTYYIKN